MFESSWHYAVSRTQAASRNIIQGKSCGECFDTTFHLEENYDFIIRYHGVILSCFAPSDISVLTHVYWQKLHLLLHV